MIEIVLLMVETMGRVPERLQFLSVVQTPHKHPQYLRQHP